MFFCKPCPRPAFFLDKTFQYEYNGIGNITRVITTPTNGSASTISFTYGDATHPDRLTSYNGKAITYNTMGCPVSYDGKTLTWTKGKLTKITSGSNATGQHTYNYTYNALGQRAEKSYSYFIRNASSGGFGENAVVYTRSTNTKYYYDYSGRLVAEYTVENLSDFTQTSTRLEYLYDGSGMVGFVYTANGVNKGAYYYQRNLQGDVVAIYNTSGTKIVEYRYDAFGNCTVATSTSDYALATINPIRYRGYYFDQETGWYFLNARYYSPEWRRFISPDDTYYLNPKNVNGCNLYAYCINNPIMYVDPMGTFLYTYWDEDGGYDLDAETFKSFGGGGGGYLSGATDGGNSLYSGSASNDKYNYQSTSGFVTSTPPKWDDYTDKFTQKIDGVVDIIEEAIKNIHDKITEGAPGYATDVYILPKATFSSGTGPGGAGVQHAGDLIFSRFFGEHYVLTNIN